MAILVYQDEASRESYLAWATKFMARGLKLEGEIEVHGPHAPPANKMWGEAWCRTLDGHGIEAVFETAPCGSIWEIRGLKVRDKRTGESYVTHPLRQFPPHWTAQIKQLKWERSRLKNSARR